MPLTEVADAVLITDQVGDWEKARVLYFVFAILSVVTCISLCLSIFVWNTAKKKGSRREAQYTVNELTN